MLKFLKKSTIILAITIILLSILNTAVIATDINMNLPVDESTSGEESDSNTNNPPDGEQGNNETTDLTSPETTEGSVQNDIGGTAAPSGVSSIAQENMSFSNILNILVITVGVILILLAIAILIRLKR